jgi:hypothetical protein
MSAGGMANAAMVFAEIHVAKVVEGFDRPMPSPVSEQCGCIGEASWETGDSIDHLHGFFAGPFGRAGELADLSQPGPIIVSRQAGTGEQLSPQLTPMFFGACFSLREMLLSLAFCRGGKSRAENPPRWLLSGSVDCL